MSQTGSVVWISASFHIFCNAEQALGIAGEHYVTEIGTAQEAYVFRPNYL